MSSRDRIHRIIACPWSNSLFLILGGPRRAALYNSSSRRVVVDFGDTFPFDGVSDMVDGTFHPFPQEASTECYYPSKYAVILVFKQGQENKAVAFPLSLISRRTGAAAPATSSKSMQRVVATEEAYLQTPLGITPAAVHFSPNGERWAVATVDTVLIFSCATIMRVHTAISAKTGPNTLHFCAIRFSPCSRMFAIGCADATIDVCFMVSEMERRERLKSGSGVSGLTQSCFVIDRSKAVSQAAHSSLPVKKVELNILGARKVSALCWSNCGRFLCAHGDSRGGGTICTYSTLDDFALMHRFSITTEPVHSLEFHFGRLLVIHHQPRSSPHQKNALLFRVHSLELGGTEIGSALSERCRGLVGAVSCDGRVAVSVRSDSSSLLLYRVDTL